VVHVDVHIATYTTMARMAALATATATTIHKGTVGEGQTVLQFSPPQSTPSSLPFRTPSEQEIDAPGRKMHCPPTLT
jgi:hypothetical protein